MPYLSRTARLLSVGLIALPFLAAVSTNVNAQSPSDFVGVTDAMLEDPAPGDWLTWRRTPDGWGYTVRSIRSTATTSALFAWPGRAP